MKLVEPVPPETRSSLADWAELASITSDRRQLSEASLISLHEQYADDDSQSRMEPETEEIVDEAILQSAQEKFIESVVAEILYRCDVLHGHYPFTVNTKGVLLSFPQDESKLSVGQWVYLFCLLCSAIREDKLQPKNQGLEKRIPELFQVCACVAAAGYLSGAVSSFGFPRATGTAFLPALAMTYKRFGEGTVRSKDDVPPGYPTELKDGGIDIIAWKDSPDKLPGKLYLLGQCASGVRWREKSVEQYLKPFHGNWFTGYPPSDPIKAMFIPFTAHHKLETRDDVDFLELLRNYLLSATFTFGVIQDRLRIAYFADLGAKLPDNGEVDCRNNIDDVKSWVSKVLRIVRGH